MRSDGAWYGAIGLQAWRSGGLWTLAAGPGELYFNKPPLAFWVHGLMLHVFGPGAAAARLPSIAAAGIAVVATVGLARTLAGARAGMLAGVMLATTIEFFRRTREISLDMWQLAFLMVAAWMVANGAGRGRHSTVVLAGVPLGLALMAKPLVALAAVPVLAAWLVWIGRGRAALSVVAAALVAVGIALPWHASMIALHGQAFTAQYFGSEIAGRATGQLSAEMDSVKPWWFYLEHLGAGGWPWLVCAGLAVVTWARGREMSPERAGERWALAWGLGWLVLLTLFPDRRDRYALPMWPALAVLGGVWWAGDPWRWSEPVTRWVERWGVVAFAVLGMALALLPLRVHEPPAEHWAAVEAWLREHPRAEVWTAGWQPARAARVYLLTGRWPEARTGAAGVVARGDEPEGRAPLPPGAVLLYHRDVPATRSAAEVVLLDIGDLTLTRVGGVAH